MNTAAGIVAGRSFGRVVVSGMGRGSPEPDTGVKVARRVPD